MMRDVLALLRLNCPNEDCEYFATGWDDLKLHVRGVHGLLMWYSHFSFPQSRGGLNYAQTVVFAFG